MQEDVINSCAMNTTNNKTSRVATRRNSTISGQQAGYTNAINSTMALRTHHMQHHEVVTRAHPTQHLDQWRAARRSTCRTGGFSAKSLEQPTSFAPSQHCAPIHATVALQQLHSNEHAQCGYINTRSLLAAHHSLTRRTAPLHLATGPWSRAIRVTWQAAASPALLPQATTSLLNATWRKGRGEANSQGLHP
jgi:hypothetical protein